MKRIMSIAFIALAALTSCSKKDVTTDAVASPAVENLTAAFTMEGQFPKEGSPVKFINNSTGAATYKWDFGNGKTSVEASPSISYAACGAYDVHLTVTDMKGHTKDFTNHITIDCIFRAPGQPPVVHDPVF